MVRLGLQVWGLSGFSKLLAGIFWVRFEGPWRWVPRAALNPYKLRNQTIQSRYEIPRQNTILYIKPLYMPA